MHYFPVKLQKLCNACFSAGISAGESVKTGHPFLI